MRNLFAARNNKSYRNHLLHQSNSFSCEETTETALSENKSDEAKAATNKAPAKRPRVARAIALWQQVLDANPKIPPHIREGLDIGGWAEGKISATYENAEGRELSDVETRRLQQLLSQHANEELILELILHDANKQSPEEMRLERLMKNPLVASLLTRFDAELA